MASTWLQIQQNMPVDSKKASSSEEKFELVFVLPIDMKDQKVAQIAEVACLIYPNFFSTDISSNW